MAMAPALVTVMEDAALESWFKARADKWETETGIQQSFLRFGQGRRISWPACRRFLR
jgi:hypothetical protein